MSKNNPLKRTLTLDLNVASQSTSKKARIQQLQQNHNHILTSPDVQMLKLTSPELAEFLTKNPTLATPTPSSYGFPKTVTEEQEMYAKGFEEALKNMHQNSTGPTQGDSAGSHVIVVTTSGMTPITMPPSTSSAILTIEKATSAFRNKMFHAQHFPPQLAQQVGRPPLPTLPQPTIVQLPVAQAPPPPQVLAPFSNAGSGSEMSRPSSGASGSLDSSAESPFPFNQIHIKVEGDDMETSSSCSSNKRSRKRGASSPSLSTTPGLVSPINLESQEKIKLERKRMRNRMAASKCRKRKLERISQLDTKVSDLKGENAELANVVKKLKDAVCNLKQEVMEHVKSGCQISLVNEGSYEAILPS